MLRKLGFGGGSWWLSAFMGMIFLALLAMYFSATGLVLVAVVMNFLTGILGFIFLLDKPKTNDKYAGDTLMLVVTLSGIFSVALPFWNPLNFPMTGVPVSHICLIFSAAVIYRRFAE